MKLRQTSFNTLLFIASMALVGLSLAPILRGVIGWQ